MGSIFHSLQRANLDDIVGLVNSIRKQKRDEENLAKLNQLYSQAENSINQEYQTTGVDNMNYQPGKGSLGKLMSLSSDGKNSAQTDLPEEQPGDFILGDVNKPIADNITPFTPQNRIPSANRNAMKHLVNYHKQGMTTPGMDEQKLERGGALLRMVNEANQPTKTAKPETVTVKDGDTVLSYDPNTGGFAPIYENIKDSSSKSANKRSYYETDEKGEVVYYDLPNKQKARKKITVDESGQQIGEDYEELSREPKGTTININPNEVDVHQLVGKIETDLANVTSGQLDESASKYAMSEVIGNSEALIEKVGLKDAVNNAWYLIQNRNFTPEQALQDVNEYLVSKGKPPIEGRNADYYKLYFKARLIPKKE